MNGEVMEYQGNGGTGRWRQRWWRRRWVKYPRPHKRSPLSSPSPAARAVARRAATAEAWMVAHAGADVIVGSCSRASIAISSLHAEHAWLPTARDASACAARRAVQDHLAGTNEDGCVLAACAVQGVPRGPIRVFSKRDIVGRHEVLHRG